MTLNSEIGYSEVYLEPCQISKMEYCATILAKWFILDVRQGSEYTFVTHTKCKLEADSNISDDHT